MHKGAAQMHRGRSLAAKDASLQRGTHRNEARRLCLHQFRAHRAYRHAITHDSTTAARVPPNGGQIYRLACALQYWSGRPMLDSL
jgi:hypothetical protein